MTAPRGFIGACLIFWGWQTGFFEMAALMALTAEGAGLLGRRWDLSLSDFNRVSDACTTIFIAMVLWLIAAKQPTRIVFIALQWLPIAYFPILMAQIVSSGHGVDLRALSLVFRKGSRNKDRAVVIDLTYPYTILCVLSAGAANLRNPGYYIGVLALTAFGLVPARSQRFSPVLWAATLTAAAVLGWFGQAGLHRLQGIIEEKGLEWFSHLNQTDPFRAVTAIGDLGALKPSDRIKFRVNRLDPGGGPLLLLEASYNSYRFSRWYAVKPQFRVIQPMSEALWSLGLKQAPAHSATVTLPLPGGKGLLPLPTGTFQITGLVADKLEISDYGSVRVLDGPGLVIYDALHHPEGLSGVPPDAADQTVPGKLAEILYGIVEAEGIGKGKRQNGKGKMDGVDSTKAVVKFLKQDFSYSLNLTVDGKSMDMADFLLRRKAGHCEYFATAAVLLLRAAGVPARYAVGYSVQEYSRLENCFVVRDRHAHAWALAWIDGTWRNVDATPPDWYSIESKAAGWTLASDLWSWVRFRVSLFRWRPEARKHLTWLIIPLGLVLIRRFYRERGGLRRSCLATADKAEKTIQPGSDSDFYKIEALISERWQAREAGETFSLWFKRLLPREPNIEQVFPLLKLHYQARFHIDGLSEQERAELSKGVDQWLKDQEKQ